MRKWRVLVAAAVLVVAAPSAAEQIAYIRDDVRVNLRAGPGLQYKIRAMLDSGERVTRIGAEQDWIQVRTEGGALGWVPAGLVGEEPPARVRLPEVEQQLAEARARLRELEGVEEKQHGAEQQLVALQARVQELTNENQRLSGSSAWKTLLAGAGIVLVGMMLGALLSRGSSSTRRIKL